ncbi:MAG TPA: hypothetical protein VGO66_00870 [Solirubrobacterales bacterium]|jgi:hypothetical protein|nr:hypothetical protein [Solirubrobacterales bacterium]
MRSRKHLILALPLAALAIAGCGGGGDDSTATTAATTVEAPPTLSKEELIAQGDAICGEVNAAVGAIGASEAEVAEQINQTADLYTGLVEGLNDLGAPEDTAGYSEFIAAAEELAKVEGEVKLATEREDTAAIGEAAEQATPALEEFQSTAAEYGFQNCSEGPSAPTASPGPGTEAPSTGGEEVAPEESEVPAEEVAPEVEEEVAPETGGAGGAGGEVAPEAGGGTEAGGGSGGIGPG